MADSLSVRSAKDKAKIRDQLGNDPQVSPILNADYDEEAYLEGGPGKAETLTLGHVWIAGSSTNAIVGSWTGTQDGQQLVVGPDGTGGRTNQIEEIINPNNIFHEHFRDEGYINSPLTSATINLTTGTVTFTTGDILTSSCIAYNGVTTYTSSRINPVSSGTLSYSIGTANSPSSPITWQSVTVSTNTTLTNPNKALFYKVSSDNATLTDIDISYS